MDFQAQPVSCAVKESLHAPVAPAGAVAFLLSDDAEWVNGQVGKTQRLSALRLIDELPRSAIGKVLKRELREAWTVGTRPPP